MAVPSQSLTQISCLLLMYSRITGQKIFQSNSWHKKVDNEGGKRTNNKETNVSFHLRFSSSSNFYIKMNNEIILYISIIFKCAIMWLFVQSMVTVKRNGINEYLEMMQCWQKVSETARKLEYL